jgi:hypothetical protein
MCQISPSESDKKMQRTFLIEDDLSLVIFCHLLCIHTRILYIAPDSGIPFAPVRNRLEEGGAARTRTTQDKAHFSRLEDAGGAVVSCESEKGSKRVNTRTGAGSCGWR